MMMLTLFLVPLISSFLCFFIPFFSKKIAFLLSLIPLFCLITWGYSFLGAEIRTVWFPQISIEFYLKVDPLAWVFLLLTAFIIPVSFFAMPEESHPVLFGLVLLLQSFLFAFFTSRDLFCFTFFWEAILIPLYFIVILFGEGNRQTVSLKFLVYMIAGSSLMIFSILALYFTANTFDMDKLAGISFPYASWIFGLFVLAFAVKTPLFPFHAWLPDVYYEASTAGTILLSALLSKAGIFGFLRIGFELFPEQMQVFAPPLLTLAIIGVLYGAFAAWGQTDFKRLIAYSSFSHVNFVLAGVFIWNRTAHTGAILQAFNHGVTITALFLVAGWLSGKIKTTVIASCSGIAASLPILSWVTLFFVLSSIALPGTNSFIGEILILFGLISHKVWIAPILTLTVIFTAIYMLRFMEKIFFGTPIAFSHRIDDLGMKEWIPIIPLIGLILWIGIYPAPFLALIELFTQKG